MDGRLKAALTTYLIREGVKPSRLGNILSVGPNTYHDMSYEPHEADCDIEPEIEIEYDYWTDDMTHSLVHIYTVEEHDFEKFLTHLANYRQEI